MMVLFIVTQLAAGLVMSSRVENRSQKILMFALPVVFAPFIATQPAGLGVYWIATNVWTLGQQLVVYTFFPPPSPRPQPRWRRRDPAPTPRGRRSGRR